MMAAGSHETFWMLLQETKHALDGWGLVKRSMPKLRPKSQLYNRPSWFHLRPNLISVESSKISRGNSSAGSLLPPMLIGAENHVLEATSDHRLSNYSTIKENYRTLKQELHRSRQTILSLFEADPMSSPSSSSWWESMQQQQQQQKAPFASATTTAASTPVNMHQECKRIIKDSQCIAQRDHAPESTCHRLRRLLLKLQSEARRICGQAFSAAVMFLPRDILTFKPTRRDQIRSCDYDSTDSCRSSSLKQLADDQNWNKCRSLHYIAIYPQKHHTVKPSSLLPAPPIHLV